MQIPRSVLSITPRAVFDLWQKEGKRLKVYLGIDPTADRLHIGHGISLRLLKKFHDAGHDCTLLLGTMTGAIGDPTGREETRPVLTYTQAQVNAKKLSTIIDQSFGDFYDLRLNREDWFGAMTVPEFLKYCQSFTLQQLEERDMFEKRREEGKGISIPEFLVPILQGIDSHKLDVDVEIGGSDQLFNMLAGRKLQRDMGGKEKVCITTNLLLGTDGRKMSKTFDNCIYLDDTPKDKFGKTMSISDELVVPWAELLTDWSEEVLEKARQAKGSEHMQWKMTLGRELVCQYHGEKQCDATWEEFKELFKPKLNPIIL